MGPGHTYVGLDAQISVMLFGVAAGAFVRLPEEGGAPGALLSVAFVLGI